MIIEEIVEYEKELYERWVLEEVVVVVKYCLLIVGSILWHKASIKAIPTSVY